MGESIHLTQNVKRRDILEAKQQIEMLTWSTKALQPIDELLSAIPSDTARKAVQIVRQVAFEVRTVREQLERTVAESHSTKTIERRVV